MITFLKTDAAPAPCHGISIPPLLPMGSVDDVVLMIGSIPMMVTIGKDPRITSMFWAVEGGVSMTIREDLEFGSPDVYCIKASRSVSDKAFFRLYVQVHELLGAFLLEDRNFLSVKDFRRRLR